MSPGGMSFNIVLGCNFDFSSETKSYMLLSIFVVINLYFDHNQIHYLLLKMEYNFQVN